MEWSYATHRARLARERSVSYLADRRGRDGLWRKHDRLEPDVRRDRVLRPLSRVGRLRNDLRARISADICSGDTFAYLEPAQGAPTGVLTVINGGFDPGGVRFTIPSDAVSGGLASYYGISAVKPGAGSSTNGDCGSISFCATLPTPTTLDCGDAAANCPRGARRRAPRPRFSVSRWRRRTVTWPRARPTV